MDMVYEMHSDGEKGLPKRGPGVLGPSAATLGPNPFCALLPRRAGVAPPSLAPVSSTMARFFWFPLVLCLLASALVSAATLDSNSEYPPQACANVVDQLQGSNVLVKINGSLFTFHVPSVEGGPFNEKPVQYLEVPDLREQNRTTLTCNRNSDPTVLSFDFNGCSCVLKDTSLVANGVNKTARTITVSQCPAPFAETVTTMLISVTNITTEEYYDNTLPYSSASNFSYTNPAGGVKFGIHIENWNWSASGLKDTNNTYVTFGLLFGVRDQKSIQILPSGPQDYQLVTEYEGFKIILSLDWGIVLDNKPAIFAYKTVDEPLTLTGAGEGDAWYGFNTSVSFCQPVPADAGQNLTYRMPLEHWTSMYYDPSLQVLFSDFGTNPAPTNSRTWVLAVSIALPIIAALIILTIILLVILVPSVKNFFLPYNRDNMENKRHSKQESNSKDDNAKEWRRSVVPCPPADVKP